MRGRVAIGDAQRKGRATARSALPPPPRAQASSRTLYKSAHTATTHQTAPTQSPLHSPPPTCTTTSDSLLRSPPSAHHAAAPSPDTPRAAPQTTPSTACSRLATVCQRPPVARAPATRSPPHCPTPSAPPSAPHHLPALPERTPRARRLPPAHTSSDR